MWARNRCWRSSRVQAAEVTLLRRHRVPLLEATGTMQRHISATTPTPTRNENETADLREGPPKPAASVSPSQKFSSTIRFPIPDSKVTSENLPSAKELDGMIPSLADLQRQIPSATAMEKKYVFRDAAAAPGAAPQGLSSSTSPLSSSSSCGAPVVDDEIDTPLHPNADTPEELLDEMRYGADDETKPPPPTSQQVALAWRALAWGTVIATVGVLLVTVIGLYVSGFHSVSDLRSYLAGREEREQQRLRTSLGNDGEVRHFVLDLTKPLDLPDQVEQILAAVQQMAEDEAANAQARSS